MKLRPSLRVALASLAGAAFLPAQEAPAPAAPPPADHTIMIADLRAEQPGLFRYATWDGNTVPTKSGLAVLGAKGAMGNGGMGRDLSAPLDCNAMKYVEVALGTMPANEVPQVTIALNDADGTQFTARIPVDHLVPGSPVWLRARREDFRLNAVEPGADSAMDWSKVTRWHLQGDWNTRKPIHVIFVALRVRS
jgi:hypothetical protein